MSLSGIKERLQWIHKNENNANIWETKIKANMEGNENREDRGEKDARKER